MENLQDTSISSELPEIPSSSFNITATRAVDFLSGRLSSQDYLADLHRQRSELLGRAEALDLQRQREPENTLLAESAERLASLDGVLAGLAGLVDTKSSQRFLELRQDLLVVVESLAELQKRLYESASEQERTLCSRCQSVIVGYVTNCPRCGCAKPLQSGVALPNELEVQLNPELKSFEQFTRECFESGENYQQWLNSLNDLHSKYAKILDGLENSAPPQSSLLAAWGEMKNGLSLIVDSLTVLVEYTAGEFGIEDFELLWGHVESGFRAFQFAARKVESGVPK